MQNQKLKEYFRNLTANGKLLNQEVVNKSPVDDSLYDELIYRLSLNESGDYSSVGLYMKINLDDTFINILKIEDYKDNYIILNLETLEYFDYTDLLETNSNKKDRICGISYKFTFPDNFIIKSAEKDIMSDNLILLKVGLVDENE